MSDEAIERRKAFLELFQKYDADRNGTISMEEFSDLYKELQYYELVSRDTSSTYEEMDTDNGMIKQPKVSRIAHFFDYTVRWRN